MTHVDIWCADGSAVILNNKVHIEGHTHLASTEGKMISIGENCLFSSKIVIRNGDSHSIVNGLGSRINFAQDVIIGDYVWIGQRVTILKGVNIGNHCIIGSSSLLTHGAFHDNTVIVGNPGRIVKEGIDWLPNLL